jgi:hypothetical protein
MGRQTVFYLTADTALVCDNDHHEWLKDQRQRDGTTATTTLDLSCVSEQVFQGPTLIFG